MTLRKFNGLQLVVATHNLGKLEEIQNLLAGREIEVLSAKSLELPVPDETESTFAGNAKIKAHAAAQASNLPALADDSGIEIDGLDGAPGVYTADWAETPDGRNFDLAMTRAWRELEENSVPFPRKARFRCTLVLAWPDGHCEIFDGSVEGQCVWPMRGKNGHGYDPIFQPNGYEITFGEMDRWEKNHISHRADAFRKLMEGCFAG